MTGAAQRYIALNSPLKVGASFPQQPGEVLGFQCDRVFRYYGMGVGAALPDAEIESGIPKPTETPRAELHTHLGGAVDPPILWSIRVSRCRPRITGEFEAMVTMKLGSRKTSTCGRRGVGCNSIVPSPDTHCRCCRCRRIRYRIQTEPDSSTTVAIDRLLVRLSVQEPGQFSSPPTSPLF